METKLWSDITPPHLEAIGMGVAALFIYAVAALLLRITIKKVTGSDQLSVESRIRRRL